MLHSLFNKTIKYLKNFIINYYKSFNINQKIKQHWQLAEILLIFSSLGIPIV